MVTDMKQGIRGALRMGGVASLVTVLAAAALVQGCGGSSGTSLSATWELRENGTRVSCAPGDRVLVKVDTNAMTADFACSAGEGLTPAVSCGVNHQVTVTLVDSTDAPLSAVETMSVFVPCAGVYDLPHVTFDIGATCPDGAISTSWSLAENLQPVACAPGDEVDLRVDTDAMTVTFPCSAMQGTSPAVTGGVSHAVSLKLFDKDGNLLSSTNMMNINVPCGATAATPKVTFDL